MERIKLGRSKIDDIFIVLHERRVKIKREAMEFLLNFKPSFERKINLVILSLEELDIRGDFLDVYRRAIEKGLLPCPFSVAPQLLIEGFLFERKLIVGMKPFLLSKGRFVLTVARDELGAVNVLDYLYANYFFAFEE